MPRQAIDDEGRTVALAAPPSRIVSLVPSLTETVCALGASERLAGVTRYCVEPAAIVVRLPRVGGTKNPDREAVTRLAPDLILMNSEENRREDFEWFVERGMTVFVAYPRTVPDAADMIGRLGSLIGAENEATRLAAEIRRECEVAVERRRLRVFCPIWRNPWMSFNADSFAHDVLFRAGADNVCAGLGERYPVIDLDGIAAADPEILLFPDEPYHFKPEHLADPGPLARTTAWRQGRIRFIDGKALSWYGPRTPVALRELRKLVQQALTGQGRVP